MNIIILRKNLIKSNGYYWYQIDLVQPLSQNDTNLNKLSLDFFFLKMDQNNSSF